MRVDIAKDIVEISYEVIVDLFNESIFGLFRNLDRMKGKLTPSRVYLLTVSLKHILFLCRIEVILRVNPRIRFDIVIELLVFIGSLGLSLGSPGELEEVGQYFILSLEEERELFDLLVKGHFVLYWDFVSL